LYHKDNKLIEKQVHKNDTRFPIPVISGQAVGLYTMEERRNCADLI